jgi:hypothetical protein
MKERTPNSAGDSPFTLLATLFCALTDALNLRYLRQELYGESVDFMPPRTIPAEQWQVVPRSPTRQLPSDHRIAARSRGYGKDGSVVSSVAR